MEDFIMYEKYLEKLEEAAKIRNLKERSINCYKNYVSYFLKYQGKNPEELTCQDVRTFLLAKIDEGLKATTLNLYNSAIRFFYRNVLHILWDDIMVPRMILEHKHQYHAYMGIQSFLPSAYSCGVYWRWFGHGPELAAKKGWLFSSREVLSRAV